MDRHLNTLEFPKILEQLARHARFSAGKTLALALRPSPYFTEVQARQAETGEACRLLAVQPNIGVGSAQDVRPLVRRARRAAILTPDELLQVRQTLIAARDLQRAITRQAETYPRLADIAGRIEPCPGLVNEIGQAIDERGQVKSSASPALARIRRDLEVAHSRLMDRLNRIITSRQYAQFLQEALITRRGGRYVVPLKAEFKGRIQGVVHDQSASGATLFVEPLATVELNNRWRQLQLDEADEVTRILAELSALVGRQARLITHTVAALAELDLALARARYAEALDAVEPVLLPPEPSAANATAAGFNLVAARHPLLDPQQVVPINITLPPQTHLLVITGPNTGGKTVSLKTAGLLAAMAQAGLRIPAETGSSLPVFNHILADIGDEQSIEQSLSTFSGHMTNIVQILEMCDRRSLVILDELGAGTDPAEGSALARAILSYLLQKGVTTFVATHFSELKAYAHTTPGVTNASMEFDPDTLAPTFHLRIGLPGASNAFTVARRLGLPEEIINQARGLVGEEARQIEAMLAEIKAELAAARQARQQAQALAAARERRLAEVDAERREILNSARADARREIKAARQAIRELKARAASVVEHRPAAAAPPLPEVENVEAELDRLEAEIAPEPAPAAEPAPQRLSGPVRPGDRVFIPQFGAMAEVVSIQDTLLEVQMGHFRATAPLDGVELRERAADRPEPGVSVMEPAVESPGMELDLRGQVTEEALHNLAQYLDRAFLARLPWVRIIHGKGSGVLRQAVREELRGHPQVSSFRPGDEGEGGEGVTVARLATG